MNRGLITELHFSNVITEKLCFLFNPGVSLDRISVGGKFEECRLKVHLRRTFSMLVVFTAVPGGSEILLALSTNLLSIANASITLIIFK